MPKQYAEMSVLAWIFTIVFSVASVAFFIVYVIMAGSQFQFPHTFDELESYNTSNCPEDLFDAALYNHSLFWWHIVHYVQGIFYVLFPVMILLAFISRKSAWIVPWPYGIIAVFAVIGSVVAYLYLIVYCRRFKLNSAHPSESCTKMCPFQVDDILNPPDLDDAPWTLAYRLYLIFVPILWGLTIIGVISLCFLAKVVGSQADEADEDKRDDEIVDETRRGPRAPLLNQRAPLRQRGNGISVLAAMMKGDE